MGSLEVKKKTDLIEGFDSYNQNITKSAYKVNDKVLTTILGWH